jgi:alpha-L-fucosidase
LGILHGLAGKTWFAVEAENFDPEGLMDLFVQAGAKYFVAQAAHHDNFHNWNSTHHPGIR